MRLREKALQRAHAENDFAALVDLYAAAAHDAPDPDRAAFYLTYAHVYALEIAHPATDALRAALIDAGRETPLADPRPPLR